MTLTPDGEHFSFTYRDVQRHLNTLMEETRGAHRLPTQEESLPVALDLMYLALSMKPAYQTGAMLVATRYCARVGLDPQVVEEFAATRIFAAMNGGESA